MYDDRAMKMLADYSFLGLSYALACVDHAGEEWAATHLPPMFTVLHRMKQNMEMILRVNAATPKEDHLSDEEVSEMQAWIQAVENVRAELEEQHRAYLAED